jgi:hypothetical protein
VIRRLVRVLAGVFVLSTFLAIGDAPATSGATGTLPTVSKITPNIGPSTGGTDITITGTNFVSGASVTIGQGDGPILEAIPANNVVVVSSTEITATTGGGAKAGAWSLFVTTAGGTNVGAVKFTYSVPPPTVANVIPNSGSTRDPTTITITGTNFISGARVEIGQGHGITGAIAATDVLVVSSTEIQAVTGNPALAGTFSLYVTTSYGTSTANSDADFTYSVGQRPTVTAISPDSGPATGGTPITITGTGFDLESTVAIGQGNGTTGAIAATDVQLVSSTEITAVTGGGAKAGTFSLFVTTTGDISPASSAHFTYTPTVTSVSPNTGPASGGTNITIMGSGFQSPTTVAIGQGNGTTGAIAATNVDVVSSNEITATTGGGAKAGTFSLLVVSNNVTSPGSFGAHFTYNTG